MAATLLCDNTKKPAHARATAEAGGDAPAADLQIMGKRCMNDNEWDDLQPRWDTQIHHVIMEE